MWISGLRGAMAYALALKSTNELAIGPVILIDTLLYSFLTILGIGSILHPILVRMDVQRKDNVDDQRPVTDNCCNRLKARIIRFNSEYFSPLFIK